MERARHRGGLRGRGQLHLAHAEMAAPSIHDSSIDFIVAHVLTPHAAFRLA